MLAPVIDGGGESTFERPDISQFGQSIHTRYSTLAVRVD
jgi:hypothetical protein